MLWVIALLGCPGGPSDYFSAPFQVPLLVTPDEPEQDLDVSVSASVVKESKCEAALLVQGEVRNACPDPVTLEVHAGEELLDSLEVPGSLGAGSMWLDVETPAVPLPAEHHVTISLDGTCTPTAILDLTGWVHCDQGEQDYVVVTVTPL